MLPPPTPVRPSARDLLLHALDWNPAGDPPVLFLHGWQDHCRSFDWVIEALPRAWRPLALDFRGHGQSGHLSTGGGYYFADYLLDVEAVLDALSLPRAHLVGHSMGGAVALIYAGARPERVRSLTLIENLGTWNTGPEEAVTRLREFLDDGRKPLRKRTYRTMEEAVARVRESNSSLSEEAARHMTRFGVRPVEGGLQFTYDPAVRLRSGHSLDEEQLLAVMGEVRCPVQVIHGTHGYSLDDVVMRRRLERLGSPLVVAVEGGHHVHLDRPAEVASHLTRFISAQGRCPPM